MIAEEPSRSSFTPALGRNRHRHAVGTNDSLGRGMRPKTLTGSIRVSRTTFPQLRGCFYLIGQNASQFQADQRGLEGKNCEAQRVYRRSHETAQRTLSDERLAPKPAAPTRPMDPTIWYLPRAWTNFRLRNWDPRSVLSRVRLNTDYAEVCIKPRIRGDGLYWPGLLADSSA